MAIGSGVEARFYFAYDSAHSYGVWRRMLSGYGFSVEVESSVCVGLKGGCGESSFVSLFLLFIVILLLADAVSEDWVGLEFLALEREFGKYLSGFFMIPG